MFGVVSGCRVFICCFGFLMWWCNCNMLVCVVIGIMKWFGLCERLMVSVSVWLNRCVVFVGFWCRVGCSGILMMCWCWFLVFCFVVLLMCWCCGICCIWCFIVLIILWVFWLRVILFCWFLVMILFSRKWLGWLLWMCVVWLVVMNSRLVRFVLVIWMKFLSIFCCWFGLLCIVIMVKVIVLWWMVSWGGCRGNVCGWCGRLCWWCWLFWCWWWCFWCWMNMVVMCNWV